MKSRLVSVCALACLLAMTMGLPGRAAGQTSGAPGRFTAFAVNMGNFAPTRTGRSKSS
jgi:hypothetical protein